MIDGNRVEPLDVASYFAGGIETEEQLEAALDGPARARQGAHRSRQESLHPVAHGQGHQERDPARDSERPRAARARGRTAARRDLRHPPRRNDPCRAGSAPRRGAAAHAGEARCSREPPRCSRTDARRGGRRLPPRGRVHDPEPVRRAEDAGGARARPGVRLARRPVAGFREFCGLAPGLVQLPDQGYRLYLESLFDEIGQEVGILFDRRDPSSLIWPRRQALNELLEILNAQQLAAVWDDDETIGWVYQYFNSSDERKQMRDESQAPRNSRELAVRNQFFTPRYVVRFLVDNTLGRTWWQMRRRRHPAHGDLRVPRARQRGRAGARQEGSARHTILDPACGSGHFLLYAFDLLQTIYEEAWEHGPPSAVTGRTLRDDYPDIDVLRANIPRLILTHNLHGIEIDPRCAQIASLALWMRAQRAYRDLGFARDARQPITKTNVVIAEPMPGEQDIRDQVLTTLDPQLRELVNRVFEEMLNAAEVGSLLKVDESIHTAISEIYGGYGGLFADDDQRRWKAAERDLSDALAEYLRRAEETQAFRRRLFVDDALAGLAFIDACVSSYDVVVANPPFGAIQEQLYPWLRQQYPNAYQDLYAAFLTRALNWVEPRGGRVGQISSTRSSRANNSPGSEPTACWIH